MSETRIAVKALGPEGGSFVVDDPAVWSRPIAECSMNCRVTRPLAGSVEVIPQENGCLARGRLTGEIVVPCDRCAEDAVVVIDHRFESFEPFPESAREGEPGCDGETDELVIHIAENGGIEFDLGGLLWEEFALCVPFKPLCRPDCRGVCPVCGQNRNEGECDCGEDKGDPRLAALRGLRVQH